MPPVVVPPVVVPPAVVPPVVVPPVVVPPVVVPPVVVPPVVVVVLRVDVVRVVVVFVVFVLVDVADGAECEPLACVVVGVVFVAEPFVVVGAACVVVTWGAGACPCWSAMSVADVQNAAAAAATRILANRIRVPPQGEKARAIPPLRAPDFLWNSGRIMGRAAGGFQFCMPPRARCIGPAVPWNDSAASTA